MDAFPRRSAPARTSTRPSLGTCALGVVTAVLVLMAAAMAPSTAAAADASAWPTEAEQCGGVQVERGGGQMDARGWLYLACSKTGDAGQQGAVHIYDAGGVLQRIVPLRGFPMIAGKRNMASDVAPSPDGSSIYVFRYDSRTVHRIARQADGSYLYDPTWALADVPGRGAPRGMFLTTDANGDIYVSSGLWSPGAPQTIAKYRANGTFVTSFGSIANSWALGVAYDEFTGIAVTANGGRVFVADKLNSRVHRFDLQANGTYAPVIAFGNSQALDPNRGGACNQPGRLASPYDVALSPGGEVQVMSTTCYYKDPLAGTLGIPVGTIEVQRFGQDGSARGMARGIATTYQLVHGLAVDRVGSIHLPQGGILLRRPAGVTDAGADVGGGGPMGGTAAPGSVGPPPGGIPGAPDTAAPILTSVITPTTSKSNTISLVINARDDRAVTGVRVTEDGAAFAWRAFATPLTHTLAGLGQHTLAVQVRDAAGNVSAIATIRVTVTAATANPVPNQPKPNNPGTGTATGGGVTANSDRTAPAIRKVVASAQLTRGRKLPVTVTATDNVRGALVVRFATERGTWGKWQSIRGTRTAFMTPGAGWKGVFIQVRDTAGNRSRPWFQAVLVAPKKSMWKRGTNAADRMVGTRTADHIELASYDGKVDKVRCGAGRDTVLLQAGDTAAKDCEVVVRVKTPAW